MVRAELSEDAIFESYNYSVELEKLYLNSVKIAPPSLESHRTTNEIIGSTSHPSCRAPTQQELQATLRLVQMLVEHHHAISIQEFGWWEVADAVIVQGFGVNKEGDGAGGWYTPLFNGNGTGLATTMVPGELWRRADLEGTRGVKTIRVDISLENGDAGKWMNGKRPREEEQQGMKEVAGLVVERACPYIVSHGTPARDTLESALGRLDFAHHDSTIKGSLYITPGDPSKLVALLPLHHPQNLRASHQAGGTEAARLQGEAWMRAADQIWVGLERGIGPMVKSATSHLLAYMEKESRGFVGASHSSNRDHLIRLHAAENEGDQAVEWEVTPGYVQTKMGADHGVYDMDDFNKKVVDAGWRYQTKKARQESVVTPTGVVLSAWGTDGGKPHV